MNAIIILLAVSLLVASGFLLSYIVSARNGQFDDDYSPAQRILFEDNIKNENNN